MSGEDSDTEPGHGLLTSRAHPFRDNTEADATEGKSSVLPRYIDVTWLYIHNYAFRSVVNVSRGKIKEEESSKGSVSEGTWIQWKH